MKSAITTLSLPFPGMKETSNQTGHKETDKPFLIKKKIFPKFENASITKKNIQKYIKEE